ncbi:MAG: efflux RND transporter periplasmic adaptor subunit [Desulfobacteraceae bacterium]|nr:efflux RND transporter periplasmic adaptor subunit [Desulfobacteraceae bacterium]
MKTITHHNITQRVNLGMIICLVIFVSIGCNNIEPGRFEAKTGKGFTPTNTAGVEIEEITDWYEAVGTLRPRTETRIEAQITAQVLDVKVNSGSKVTKGQLLVVLDSRQLQSRLDQARQAKKSAVAGMEQSRQRLIAAEAAFKQAEAAYNRVKGYYASQAATASELEKAESAYLQAKAGVKQASEGLAAAEAGILQTDEVIKESAIAMGYTKITATADGMVLNRFTEPGDLALPGKPLLTLRTSGALRLEAFVREGLIDRVTPGQVLKVIVQAVDRTMDTQVEEVVPYADPQSRTFLVKSALPVTPGIYPGMFGKLLIPVSRHKVILIPRVAVRRVGQLETVFIEHNGSWQSRFIKTGKTLGDRIEVLSGLNGKETIGWKESENA